MAAPEARLARVVKASRCSPWEMALSKTHHAAFDNHLIRIDPDGRVHVSERLLMLHDGPLLEQSPKAIAGTTMRLPSRREHHPARDRLTARFEQFKGVALG
jgi:putative restriction endonuclease